MNRSNYIEQYNEALPIIANGDYERARQMLLETERIMPHSPLVNKTLGSIELLAGYPHLAVARWSRFSLDELGLPEERLTWAQSLLAEYDAIYERYHHALGHIKQADYDLAHVEFNALMVFADRLSLPLPIYRGYLLFLARAGEFKQVNKVIDSAPRYIQQSADIRRLLNRLEVLRTRSELQSSHKQSKRYKTAFAASIVLIAGCLSFVYLLTDKAGQTVETATVWAPKVEQLQPQSPSDAAASQEEKIAALTSQLQRVENLRTGMLSQMEAAEKKIATQETLFALSGIKEEELQGKAAVVSYNDGYRLFQAGKYEQAIEAFRVSDSFGTKTYFIDDNLYYWSQSLRKLGRVEEASKLYDRFLSETDPNYSQSPLIDDILLAKAEYLVFLGVASEAKPLLQRIIREHQGEWTAKRAQQLLKSNL